MTYRTLVVRCPITEKDLDVAGHLPPIDSSYPVQVRVKTLHLPLEVLRCPECGKPHRFDRQDEIREVLVAEEYSSGLVTVPYR